MRISHLLAAAALAISAAAPVHSQSVSPEEVPYRKLAQEFLEQFDIEDKSDFQLDRFLERKFLCARLGMIELCIPADGMKAPVAKDYEALAQSIIDLQSTWIEWSALPGDDLGDLQSDIDKVSSWVKSWGVGKLKAAEPGDLLAGLGADEETVAAAQRFTDFMGKGTCVGLERDRAKLERVVLIPDRTTYVRSVAMAGLMFGGSVRNATWVPASVNFTEHRMATNCLFLAMQYAPNGASLDRFEPGSTMNWRSGTGLRQQVAQITANAMFANLFGDKMPASLVGGLSLNLVIELYGECNTRVDGDLRGRRTDAREMFVPGGLSEGGRLPPNMADSRWRERGAEGHFVRILKESQKAGAKGARKKIDKLLRFELQDDNKEKKMVLEGPFLGSNANPESITVPDAFYGDQLEFLRAYRCAFIHYLREGAHKKKGQSAQAFARLVRGVAGLEELGAIEALIAETYGAPSLSQPEMDMEQLEARFLKWISKG